MLSAQSANADVYVRGYYRSNDTYVAPHYRSDPDGKFYNNWTTFPNINPYTGMMGTRRTPPTPRMSFPSYRLPRVPPAYGWPNPYGSRR
jgi:hypothetical protein